MTHTISLLIVWVRDMRLNSQSHVSAYIYGCLAIVLDSSGARGMWGPCVDRFEQPREELISWQLVSLVCMYVTVYWMKYTCLFILHIFRSRTSNTNRRSWSVRIPHLHLVSELLVPSNRTNRRLDNLRSWLVFDLSSSILDLVRMGFQVRVSKPGLNVKLKARFCSRLKFSPTEGGFIIKFQVLKILDRKVH